MKFSAVEKYKYKKIIKSIDLTRKLDFLTTSKISTDRFISKLNK